MSQATQLRCCIWGLDSELTLEDVQRLQTEIDYTETIEYLSDRNDLELSDFEKKLMHRWEIIQDISLYQPRNTNDAIRYYIAKGIFETSRSEASAFMDSEKKKILPRDLRIYPNEGTVIFVELANRVYAIVYGTSAAFQVRTILMGRGLKHRRREEWKEIDVRLPQYSMGSDFYYWMYHRYHTQSVINTKYGDIEISDVIGIGRFSERQQHNTRGKGPNSTNELSNKTALGVDQLVYESDFVLEFDNLRLTLCLSENSNCIIDTRRTFIVRDTGDIEGVEGNETQILLSLYLEIIPGLISAYHSDHSNHRWNTDISRNAKRQWALDVIEELCMHHGITKQDLNQLKSIP